MFESEILFLYILRNKVNTELETMFLFWFNLSTNGIFTMYYTASFPYGSWLKLNKLTFGCKCDLHFNFVIIFSGTESFVCYTVTVLLHRWCKIGMQVCSPGTDVVCVKYALPSILQQNKVKKRKSLVS